MTIHEPVEGDGKGTVLSHGNGRSNKVNRAVPPRPTMPRRAVTACPSVGRVRAARPGCQWKAVCAELIAVEMLPRPLVACQIGAGSRRLSYEGNTFTDSPCPVAPPTSRACQRTEAPPEPEGAV